MVKKYRHVFRSQLSFGQTDEISNILTEAQLAAEDKFILFLAVWSWTKAKKLFYRTERKAGINQERRLFGRARKFFAFSFETKKSQQFWDIL